MRDQTNKNRLENFKKVDLVRFLHIDTEKKIIMTTKLQFYPLKKKLKNFDFEDNLIFSNDKPGLSRIIFIFPTFFEH